MTRRRYAVPRDRAVAGTGMMTPAWHNYLAGLSEVADRVAGPVAALDGGATLAQTIDKLNEVIAALKAAGLMRET